MKQVFKKITTLLFITLFLTRVMLPIAVFADDAAPSDTPTPSIASSPSSDTSSTNTTPTPTQTTSETPTPTPQSGSTDTATVTPTTTPDLSTQVSPTPTPSDTSTTPTPTCAPTPSASPSPDDTTTPTPTTTQSEQTSSPSCVSTGGNTNNSAANSNTSGTNTPSTTTTGNANAVAQAESDVNTTNINSQTVHQTINVFLPQDGNIDLSDPSKIAANVVSNNTADGQVFNISIVNNDAYVNTDVTAIADTGNNTSSGSGEFAINTGNATSLVQLVNKVNVTLVNSEIHFITINIYGTLNGNIILPDTSSTQASQNCTSCGSTTNASNNTTLNNNVDSSANTGTNTSTTDNGNAVVSTGNANAQINIINIINELIFGINFDYLIINDLGTWNGNFLGWGDLPATQGGTSLTLIPSITPTDPNNNSSSTNTSATNNATVNNNVSSVANTGSNTITTSSGNGMIITGNAESIASLVNLINSVFINTKGVFAFINIFGTLNGDIGEASKFITPTPQPDNAAPAKKEDGGQLTITNSNNTGPYVLPGDTVTFFITVHNSGTGKVYGAHLRLSLINNGQEGGAANYDLGDLDANKSIRITTGLVLSRYAPEGTYIAHADVTGTTGDENTALDASADSVFHIFVPAVTTNNQSTNYHKPQLPEQTVLAAHTPNEDSNSQDWLGFILGGVVGTYLTIRVIKDRQHLILTFKDKKTLKERLHSLRLFLL